MLLAIETSCDETALALFDLKRFLGGELLRAEIVSSQVALHEPFGGVVPELAAREHLENLPFLIKKIFQDVPGAEEELSAVAVTRGPGLNGCLLVGLSYAKAFAYARGIPLLALNHLEAHLFAAELEENLRELNLPALTLLVSGGHTELVLIEEFRKYRLVARTRDDAVGEAFDKSATLLGLPYPGGPALAECAKAGRPGELTFPQGMKSEPTAFSFSGVKTAVSREVTRLGASLEDDQVRADVARAVEQALVKALVSKTAKALKKCAPKTLALSGGVAANAVLREELAALAKKSRVEFRVAERRWCTDNAAMLAVLAARIIEREPKRYLDWRGKAGDLGPDARTGTGALPRWPIEKIGTAP